MSDIVIDIEKTCKNLDRFNKISWTKLNEFGTCEGLWFVRHYADIVNYERVSLEHTKAISGTLIQKMFEIFINARVYARPEMRTMASLVEWFKSNTPVLFDLLVFPYDLQFENKLHNSRYYFRRKEGKSRVEGAYLRGLDRSFKSGFQPNFIDWDIFNAEWGSREKFLKHINSLYEPMLETFIAYQLDLDKLLSEVYLETYIFNELAITGQIDFIYNKYQMSGRFESIKDIQNDFIISDGKFKVSNYVKEEQLMFYTALVGMKFKKLPGAISFWDWSKAEFDFREFDPTYFDKLREKVWKIAEKGYYLKKMLEELKDRGETSHISLYDLELLSYEPSMKNCIFCPIKDVCAEAGDVQRISEGINRKREVKKFIESQNLDPKKDIHEIKF